jgi:DNA-binding transcriptional MocR family regulator
MVVTTGAQQALTCGQGPDRPRRPIASRLLPTSGAVRVQRVRAPLPQVELDDEGWWSTASRRRSCGRTPEVRHTVPNFHNPAESDVPSSAERLVALCREACIPIVETTRTAFLRFEGDSEPTLRCSTRRTRSTWAPSPRSSPRRARRLGTRRTGVLQRLVLAKEAADLCGSNLTMLLTERYLAGETWRRTRSPRGYVPAPARDAGRAADALPSDATWTRPSGGFYIWVTLPYLDTRALRRRERRVAYVPGTAFYPDGRARIRCDCVLLPHRGPDRGGGEAAR